jgi:hypothetical protein
VGSRVGVDRRMSITLRGDHSLHVSLNVEIAKGIRPVVLVGVLRLLITSVLRRVASAIVRVVRF